VRLPVKELGIDPLNADTFADFCTKQQGKACARSTLSVCVSRVVVPWGGCVGTGVMEGWKRTAELESREQPEF